MSVEIGPDGAVYFGDDADFSRLRRVAPDGTVTTVASGQPFDQNDNDDGGPATNANIDNPQRLTFGSDGSLYLTGTDRVRRVGLDGRITTVAGGGGASAKNANRVPADSVRFSAAMGVDMAVDGTMYVASLNDVS